MQCVANGAPYVVTAVAGLRTMAWNARRGAKRRNAADETSEPDAASPNPR